MAFKEVVPITWEYSNDGDSITGVLIRTEREVGPNKSVLYILEADNKPIHVWGSTILDQKMQSVSPGSKIRITFKGLGEKKPGKNPPKIFKVEIDDEHQQEE